jgi:hypothetical protein
MNFPYRYKWEYQRALDRARLQSSGAVKRLVVRADEGYSSCWAPATSEKQVKFEAADIIRFLYASGGLYQYEIAEVYGLTQADVSQVTRNVRWPARLEGAQ